MDKVKEALDIGDKKAEKAKEGQEPVNGQKGNTAAGQPFDAGNDKEATQAADKPDRSQLGDESMAAMDSDPKRSS